MKEKIIGIKLQRVQRILEQVSLMLECSKIDVYYDRGIKRYSAVYRGGRFNCITDLLKHLMLNNKITKQESTVVESYLVNELDDIAVEGFYWFSPTSNQDCYYKVYNSLNKSKALVNKTLRRYKLK